MKKKIAVALTALMMLSCSTVFMAAQSPVAGVTDAEVEAVTSVVNTLATVEITDAETADTVKADLVALDTTVLEEVLVKDATSLATIETGYVAAKNIDTTDVDTPVVDEAVKETVGNVSITGAGLNAEANSKVAFKVATPKADVVVPTNFENAIVLDLSLEVDGVEKAELEVPVVITMDLPAGVNTENLVILHYHNSTEDFERIVPVINGNQITFVVKNFSSFAFVNEINPGNGSNDETPGYVAGQWPWNEFEAQAAAANGATDATLPKTGAPVVLPFAALACVAGAVVCGRKAK